jgi:hypothetical protein
MSAKQVSIAKLSQNKMIVGNWINLYVIGYTTITNVAEEVANYKVYGIDGKVVATGPVQARHGNWNDRGKGASMELNYEKKKGLFRLEIPLILHSDSFEKSSTGAQFVNFGIDVFLTGKYVEEGMCVQLANGAYSKEESAKADFQMNCKDNGDGTFTKGTIPNALHKFSGCNEHHQDCDGCLKYCNPQRAAFLVGRDHFARN